METPLTHFPYLPERHNREYWRTLGCKYSFIFNLKFYDKKKFKWQKRENEDSLSDYVIGRDITGRKRLETDEQIEVVNGKGERVSQWDLHKKVKVLKLYQKGTGPDK